MKLLYSAGYFYNLPDEKQSRHVQPPAKNTCGLCIGGFFAVSFLYLLVQRAIQYVQLRLNGKQAAGITINKMEMDSKKFAAEWIASWNTHNLDDILKHYAEDVEITTPMIRIATAGDTDTLQGKAAVADYWIKALQQLPDLHFELVEVTTGVNSVALYYKSVMNKMSIEVMFFNEQGKVNRIFAHYT
ncbi:nuclear transport factor 2 family protein [Ferruginibacter paludis]|uniref:nuclear transport factor 2 family protein n=1 Tax=Ferruginibacter paludis TaxID=1310417 RepID=UPI0025B40F71|nr:nuclear transport factor 2 family protein [Ferruginibacter paludis]MDN3654493.1 nuclear transport factor 2 family protein [Ferruginibacter paludis]